MTDENERCCQNNSRSIFRKPARDLRHGQKEVPTPKRDSAGYTTRFDNSRPNPPPSRLALWDFIRHMDGRKLRSGTNPYLYGKHHHPLGLSGGHAGRDVLSYSPSALETLGGEPRSLSAHESAVSVASPSVVERRPQLYGYGSATLLPLTAVEGGQQHHLGNSATSSESAATQFSNTIQQHNTPGF